MNAFVVAFYDVTRVLIDALTFFIVVRALISWVNPDPYNPVVRLIHRVTDPILVPVSRLLPSIAGFDFTPMLAILALQGFKEVVLTNLVRALY